jgi:hypothetical protein
VPCVSPQACSRIFQRLELQPVGRDADGTAIREQERPVRGHEVGELAAFPLMAVQPQATVHRVDHSIAALSELAKWWDVGGGSYAY